MVETRITETKSTNASTAIAPTGEFHCGFWGWVLWCFMYIWDIPPLARPGRFWGSQHSLAGRRREPPGEWVTGTAAKTFEFFWPFFGSEDLLKRKALQNKKLQKGFNDRFDCGTATSPSSTTHVSFWYLAKRIFLKAQKNVFFGRSWCVNTLKQTSFLLLVSYGWCIESNRKWGRGMKHVNIFLCFLIAEVFEGHPQPNCA